MTQMFTAADTDDEPDQLPQTDCQIHGHAWAEVRLAHFRCIECDELFVDEDGLS